MKRLTAEQIDKVKDEHCSYGFGYTVTGIIAMGADAQLAQDLKDQEQERREFWLNFKAKLEGLSECYDWSKGGLRTYRLRVEKLIKEEDQALKQGKLPKGIKEVKRG